MNTFQELVKEICDENNIDFELLSKDWIIKLSKNERTKYIIGMRFPINDFTSSIICKDKYATYEVLDGAGVPILEHKLIYSDEIKQYTSDLRDRAEIEDYLKNHREIVVKDNCGSEGKLVYKCSYYLQVKEALNNIFLKKDTAVICPYVEINKEYRVICLNNKVEFIFSKEKTLGEWRHNLCNGAIAKTVTDENKKKELSEFALRVVKAIGINFASVDLIEVDGKLMVLEVNSTVCMNRMMEQIDGGREIAKNIYAKAIELMF